MFFLSAARVPGVLSNVKSWPEQTFDRPLLDEGWFVAQILTRDVIDQDFRHLRRYLRTHLDSPSETWKSENIT